MPTDLPNRPRPGLGTNQTHEELLKDAFASEDAFIVSHVLREIAAAQGQRHSLGDDPALSLVLAAVAALGLDMTVKRRE